MRGKFSNNYIVIFQKNYNFFNLEIYGVTQRKRPCHCFCLRINVELLTPTNLGYETPQSRIEI